MSETGSQLLFFLANISYFVVLDKVEYLLLLLIILVVLNCVRVL